MQFHHAAAFSCAFVSNSTWFQLDLSHFRLALHHRIKVSAVRIHSRAVHMLLGL